MAIDPELLQDFHDLLAIERINLNKQVAANVSDVERKANAEGRLQSGTAMQNVTREAIKGIQTYSGILLALARRVTSMHGVGINNSNLSDFTVLLTQLLGQERELLMQFAYDSAPFHTAGNQGVVRAMDQDAAQAEAAETQRLATELRLLARATERGVTKSTGDTSIVIQGSVGSVQTGAGSVAKVNQTIDAGTREILTDALEKLLSVLESHQGELPFNRHEVEELILDARTEVKKPSPNMTRLRSIISGIGTTIEYVPKTKEALEALKWAAGLIGVLFP